MKPFTLRRGRNAFTLIELLVVIVILGILAAVIIPRFFGRTEDAKVASAKSQIKSFEMALEMFNTDYGTYPQSLDVLAMSQAPTGLDQSKWHGPYLKGAESVPVDPWGNAYVYVYPSQHGQDYDISSSGDGKTPINSWELGTKH